MIAVNYTTARQNLKDICDKTVNDFETVIITRERGENEKLPWDHIDAGITKSFLRRERRAALEGRLTPDCRTGCGACGLNCEKAGNSACASA